MNLRLPLLIAVGIGCIMTVYSAMQLPVFSFQKGQENLSQQSRIATKSYNASSEINIAPCDATVEGL